METVLYSHGFVPESVLSDNGGEFTSKVFEKLHKAYGVQIKHGLPYKPSTQGAVENQNGFTKRRLALSLAEARTTIFDINLEGINLHCSQVCDIINHEVHTTTQAIPFELFHKCTDNRHYPHDPVLGECNTNNPKYKCAVTSVWW